MSTARKRAARTKAVVKEMRAATFKGMPIDPANFNHEWDMARGFMARLAVALAVMDDKELEARGGVSAHSAHTFMDAYDKLQEEISYLKAHGEMLEKVSVRMLAVAHRFDPALRRPERPRLSIVR